MLPPAFFALISAFGSTNSYWPDVYYRFFGIFT